MRVILVYTLPAAISPIILGAITIAAIVWTFAYARHAEKRGQEMKRQREAMEAAHVEVS